MPATQYDVVYVDDERSITQIFTTYAKLEHDTWNFAAFNNSVDVYNQIQQNLIGSRVWLLDIMMPQRNGVEIANLIKKMHPDSVVLGYTALDPMDVKSKFGTQANAFNKIIRKNESVLEVLALMDVWVNPQ